VQRNGKRFPPDFVFQLSQEEFEGPARNVVRPDGRASLRLQNAILKRGQHAKDPPYAFTEHGAIMAAMVLRSPQAIAMSVYVVRAFTRMRERLAANAAILRRLAEIDGTLLRHDAALRDIYRKLLPLLRPPPDPPKRPIGFHSRDDWAARVWSIGTLRCTMTVRSAGMSWTDFLGLKTSRILIKKRNHQFFPPWHIAC
jgi:hypothetical protein